MKVSVVMPVTDTHKAALKKAAPNAEFTFGKNEAALKEADVIIGNIAPQKVKTLPKLRFLQLNSAGANTYCEPGILPDGVALTNATGAYGIAISEHILATLLFLMKHLPTYYDQGKAHCWKDAGPVRTLYGSTVAVIGFGDIGRHFGRIAKAMGAYVLGVRRRSSDLVPEADEMGTFALLGDILARADVVVSCLPDTPATQGLYTEKRFFGMKQGALFINIGRGNAVDQDALKKALQSGHLAGAAIDVATPEPLPESDPLWEAPNLLVTPHVSGGYHAQSTWDAIIAISCRNLEHFIKGEPLENIVDRETGYRK